MMYKIGEQLDAIAPHDRAKLVKLKNARVRIGDAIQPLFSQNGSPSVPLPFFEKHNVRIICDPFHLFLRLSEVLLLELVNLVLGFDKAQKRQHANSLLTVFVGRLQTLIHRELFLFHNGVAQRPSLNGEASKDVIIHLHQAWEEIARSVPPPCREHYNLAEIVIRQVKAIFLTLRPGGDFHDACLRGTAEKRTFEIGELRQRTYTLGAYWTRAFGSGHFTHSLHIVHCHLADDAEALPFSLWNYSQIGVEHRFERAERILHSNVSFASSGAAEELISEMWFASVRFELDQSPHPSDDRCRGCGGRDHNRTSSHLCPVGTIAMRKLVHFAVVRGVRGNSD